MAAKRFFNDDDEDQPNHKRMKTKPSFASVIKEVVMVNFLENFCSSLEPMLRRVVSEEVENGLRRRSMSTMLRCPSLKLIQPPSTTAASLRLEFANRLSLPIFTGTKITDANGQRLQIMLVGHDKVPFSLPCALKVEVVVLDGDFNKDAFWSNDDFSRSVVRERSGKRPLLTGDVAVTMRDGVCLVGDIEFTDNSSWIRSRKFRLAARVAAQPPAVVVGEAVTEAFVVKDHRGELYKKHHPPALDDEVWRLEKIGKGGAFHRKLASSGINTVQDFLKLHSVDSSKLKKIVGVGMSEKMWEVTLKHAKTCEMGTKMYRCYGSNYTLTFNPICQLIHAIFDGQVYYRQRDFKNMHTAYIESLVKDAYANWSSLEELDGTTPLITQGDVMGPYITNEEQQMVVRSSYDVSDHSMTSSVMQQQESGDDRWPFYINTSKNGIRFLPESSSEGDIP